MVTAAQGTATMAGVQRAAASADTEQELLGEAARLVRRTVPHSGAAWLSTDPATILFTDGVITDLIPETCRPWFHNEFQVDDVHKFRHITGMGAAVLSQHDSARRRSARWQDIMRPQGLDDELRLTLDDATGTWGAVELHREVGDPDFSHDEAQLLEQLAPIVARGLRRVAVERAAACDVPDGPGLIVVEEDGHATPLTGAGGLWLDALTRPMPGGHARTSLLTIASAARASDAPGGDARVRTRARNGNWVTLHAQPTLEGGAVAVIVEPMRPAEIALLLARAHGLSEREQEVVLLLARGRSTFEIASDLHLSPHTVRDHVKASLAKVGVNSRSELIATLFDRHYAPRLFAGPDDSHPTD